MDQILRVAADLGRAVRVVAPNSLGQPPVSSLLQDGLVAPVKLDPSLHRSDGDINDEMMHVDQRWSVEDGQYVFRGNYPPLPPIPTLNLESGEILVAFRKSTTF
jgi:hypothetical protein